jgi:hypothetical protein
MQQIIRIQPAENLTRRFCESGIQRSVETTVFLLDYATKMLLVLPNNLRSAIDRPVIHDDVFEVRVVLANYASERLFKITLSIKDSCHQT